MDELDNKVLSVFPGKVVRKDLVRRIKTGSNVPVYVLEFLLGKYCSSGDKEVIESGLQEVRDTLGKRFVRADESEKVKSLIKQRGTFRIIDKVKVRLLESQDKYWAELVNLGQRYAHISEDYIRKYDRLLAGGIWAILDMEYASDESYGGVLRPFHIKDVRPIQLASFDLREFKVLRGEFSRDEWLDLLLRSIGLEPSYFSRRVKMLLLLRLVPLVEKNYNLVELGPRGTGKSYVYREISPFSILISGGKTTVANLFYNLATNRIGLVGLWDAVAFDEVAGIHFDDKTAIQILKDYMESGSFSRGREEIPADASIVYVGNINKQVDILLKTSDLFQPFSEAMYDMALIDRLHYYLPGWEIPKVRTEFMTNRFGFVVDYLAEALKQLRNYNYTDALDKHFSLGSHLNSRDAKAVRKTVSALIKLLHPDGKYEKTELQDYLQLGLEGRRRVKEQLKKMGGFEYYKTSFSYIDKESMEEGFVGVAEEGGRNLILPDPLSPGTVYTASFADDKVLLYRIEVTKMPGRGDLVMTGTSEKSVKDSVKTAFDFMLSRKSELGIERDLESYDYHVQLVHLMQHVGGYETGVAFFVAFYSALRGQNALPKLVVLGGMTVQGNILPIPSLIEPLRLIMDNGARKVLIPLENKSDFFQIPGDIIEKVDPIFYSDPLTAALKALGVT